MAEFDGVDVAFNGEGEEGGLFGELSRLTEGTRNFEEELKSSFDGFKEKLPPSLKDSYKELTYEEGKYYMNIDDEKVDLTDVQAKFSEGDFEGAFKDLKMDVDSDEGKQFIDSKKSSFEESKKGQAMSINDDANSFADKMGDEPTSNQDMIDKAKDKGVDMKTPSDEFDSAKKGTEEEKKAWCQNVWDNFKSAVKGLISLALLYFIFELSEDLYHFLKNLAHALSGCFSYTPTGSSCKIYTLTCNNDDLNVNNTNGIPICTACQKQDCSDISPQQVGWLPLKLGASTCDPTGNSPFPGTYCPDAPTGNNPCQTKEKYGLSAEGIEGAIYAADPTNCSTSQYACPLANGCISKKEACSNSDDCSNLCTTSLLMTPAGYAVKCQSCSVWCAAAHTIKGIVNEGKDILSGAIKYLLYICLAILGFVFLFWIIKEISYYLLGSKKHKEEK